MCSPHCSSPCTPTTAHLLTPLSSSKLTDDITLSLIQDCDKSADQQDFKKLVVWCSHNNQELNTLKTGDDFRRNPPCTPTITIMNSTEMTVGTFRFLGTTISQELTWDIHIDLLKKAQQRLYFVCQLRKFNLPQELLIQFYAAVTESVLCCSITIWFSSVTKSDLRRIHQIVWTAERITGNSPHSPRTVLIQSEQKGWQNHSGPLTSSTLPL